MKNENYVYKFHDLQAAVTALYYSAYWHADRPCDERALWEAVRDAAELTPGKARERLGADRSKKKARIR